MAAIFYAAFALGLTVSPQLHASSSATAPPAAARRAGAIVAQKQQLEPEEVVEKYGLEAGLFSALKNRGNSDAEQPEGGAGENKVTPGELLKRYGGAYLLTSTSFAIVSFGICYVAVSNGIDVASLFEKIGLGVSVPTEAGTIGIAYAIHKAASPIRFPPTVALTPIVAKKLFGKDGAEAAPEEEAK